MPTLYPSRASRAVTLIPLEVAIAAATAVLRCRTWVGGDSARFTGVEARSSVPTALTCWLACTWARIRGQGW